jgi:hypothetical protein
MVHRATFSTMFFCNKVQHQGRGTSHGDLEKIVAKYPSIDKMVIHSTARLLSLKFKEY